MMSHLTHARLPNVDEGCLLRMGVGDLAVCVHENHPLVAVRLVLGKLLMPASDLRACWLLTWPTVESRHRPSEYVVTVQRT